MTFEDGLAGYVEVSERITTFREKHPEGSFQVRFIDVPAPFNEQFIAVEARAYRTPDDPRPGVDIAWEPVPGKTPYTKDSEAMNASTSAVGRAIVYALAADTHKGIASANEVRAREGGEEAIGFSPGKDGKNKQRTYFEGLLNGRDIAPDDVKRISAFANETLTRKRISAAIDALKDEEKSEATASYLFDEMVAWEAKQTQLPVDDSDLAPAEPMKS